MAGVIVISKNLVSKKRYKNIIITLTIFTKTFQTDIYLLKVNNRNTRKNFEHISHLFLVFLLLTLNICWDATLDCNLDVKMVYLISNTADSNMLDFYL